ncbi:MAG: hypothetical protein GY938_20585 [Ketobacter sp.]|nr:hypothetical protein [Ketobacter sp.]
MDAAMAVDATATEEYRNVKEVLEDVKGLLKGQDPVEWLCSCMENEPHIHTNIMAVLEGSLPGLKDAEHWKECFPAACYTTIGKACTMALPCLCIQKYTNMPRGRIMPTRWRHASKIRIEMAIEKTLIDGKGMDTESNRLHVIINQDGKEKPQGEQIGEVCMGYGMTRMTCCQVLMCALVKLQSMRNPWGLPEVKAFVESCSSINVIASVKNETERSIHCQGPHIKRFEDDLKMV